MSGQDAIALATDAIGRAAEAGARIVCFPEAFVPGYRAHHPEVAPPDPALLERAAKEIGAASARAAISVILGTERYVGGRARLTTLVFGPDGGLLGHQDKVQLDPSEDALYEPGEARRVFTIGEATFGIVICHEGWRYPETVRWAVRHDAQIVFHPHFDDHPSDVRWTTFADPRNSFHEKAALCRAAENGCWFATVNCAMNGSSTTSAIIRPDGSLLCWQPYGEEGLLVADLDLAAATGNLARRLRADALT
jgi:predicted amidohydrolase